MEDACHVRLHTTVPRVRGMASVLGGLVVSELGRPVVSRTGRVVVSGQGRVVVYSPGRGVRAREDGT